MTETRTSVRVEVIYTRGRQSEGVHHAGCTLPGYTLLVHRPVMGPTSVLLAVYGNGPSRHGRALHGPSMSRPVGLDMSVV